MPISINRLFFDGQTLRIEFGVTRFDDVRGSAPVAGRRYPSCRLVLSRAAAVDLINRYAADWSGTNAGWCGQGRAAVERGVERQTRLISVLLMRVLRRELAPRAISDQRRIFHTHHPRCAIRATKLVLIEHDLFRQPIEPPDQVRGQAFRDQVLMQRLDVRVLGELDHRCDVVGEEFSVLLGAHWRWLKADPQQLAPHRRKAERLHDRRIDLIDDIARRICRRR